jgi:SAM-dependent methyltransferase
MAIEIDIDVELLKSEIKKTYAAVSQQPDSDFIFPMGRAWAEDLDYPAELANVPNAAAESFAGVANPFALGRLSPGERVLDLGSGAGSDALVASQMVGPAGSVVGIDMTPEMVRKARGGPGRARRRQRALRRRQDRATAAAGCKRRRRHLERCHRPRSGQGRGLRGDLPGARARRPNPDLGRDDPETGKRRGSQEHRPLDRLNCRGAAGSSVRTTPGAARLRTGRDGTARRHVRSLEVRGHTREGGKVRRARHDRESVQAAALAGSRVLRVPALS